MKSKILLWLSILCVTKGSICQPQASSFNYPSAVNLFDLYEISFVLDSTYGNPYDPNSISVSAMFVSSVFDTITVNGFYYEDYTFSYQNHYEHYTANPSNNKWKVRFTPNRVGLWKFTITLTDGNGTNQYGVRGRPFNFNCNAVSNAEGFISKANGRFLKREVVVNGMRKFRSYFPIGTDLAWYSCLNDSCEKPKGIYEYHAFLRKMEDTCNYMRVFLNRYQYLNLYGPEYTQMVNGLPTVYFDSTINQKDAAEFDNIVEYAKEKGISITTCVFTCGDFRDTADHASDSSIWRNNPFNTELGLNSNCDFFTNSEARRVSRNLLRYVVSRWGYATNIMDWELWNEVNNMFDKTTDTTQLKQKIVAWHNEMAAVIRANDPFGHCVSSSMGSIRGDFNSQLHQTMFTNLDMVKHHYYANVQKAKSLEQVSYLLFLQQDAGHTAYPDKPFHMEEFGFGSGIPSFYDKDSLGIDLHNSLWASLFSSAMGPASHWWWWYLSSKKLFARYKPLLTFCSNLPVPSDSFQSYTTGTPTSNIWLTFPNSIQTYYMKNASEDTIYGWCQDTAFAYQSLRWLTDGVWLANDTLNYHYYHFMDSVVFDSTGYVYTLNPLKRPGPSSNSNIVTIPIENIPVGTHYTIKWYDSETGLLLYQSIDITVKVNGNQDKYLSFIFPTQIRNLKQNIITNTFGDAVFVIHQMENGQPGHEDKE